MNFRQIEAFRAVMMAGTVSGAGRIMFISQPAVSRLIKDLEFQLGFELFERRSNRLIPTPEATRLHQEVVRSFDGMERIEKTAEAIRNLSVGQLTLISTPMMAYRLVPEILGRFMSDYPGIFVELNIGTREQIVDLVGTQQCDLGIETPPFSDSAIAEVQLSSQPAVCALQEDHPLSCKKTVKPEDLQGVDFVALTRGSILRTDVNAVLRSASVMPKVVAETHTQQSACSMVAAGVGMTLAGPLAVHDIRSDRLCVRPFTPDIPVRYALLHSALRPPSVPATTFMHYAQRYLRELGAVEA